MNQKSLNILMLPKENYPSDRVHLTVLFEKEVTKRGHKLFWVMESKTHKKSFTEKNNSYFFIPSFGGGNIFSNIFKRLLLIHKFFLAKKIINEQKIDVIYVRSGIVEGLIGVYLSKQTGIPLCFHLSTLFFLSIEKNFHENKTLKTFLRYNLRKINKKLYYFIIKNSQLFLPVSRGMDKYIKRDFPNKNTFPIPLCADRFFLDYKTKDYSKSKSMVYIGEISFYRRPEFMIRVLKKVIQYDRHSDLKLILIGSTSKKNRIQDLKNYSKSLGVDSNVKFLGQVSYNKIPELVNNSVLGLSPRRPIPADILASPTKCVEYLSLGIPVVANKEIYDQNAVLRTSGGGFSVEYNERDFAKAIVWMLDNPLKAIEIGRRGREWVSVERNYEVTTIKLEKQFHKILEENNNEHVKNI